MNAFDELKWRGLVYDFVDGVQDLLFREKVVIYNGFDATADSLHVGHMVPLIALARLQRFGHHPIALAGGGTSLIGDPSGKRSERPLLTSEVIFANVEAIKPQLAHLLDFEVKSNPARVMNNADWLEPLNLIKFMRDIGKHFTVNYMVAKDSVRSRLDSEEGLSFTEFSYMLLQSYDFLHLFSTLNCQLQTGGSDQWGNITAGVELIRRIKGQTAYGMVYPLITKADGTKFGKTETGTIWLSAKRTSPYKFFQFWLNTDDRDVVNYLKFFTWLNETEITELENELATKPEQRAAQRRLAREMTRRLHDESGLQKAEQAAQVLFGGELTGLSTTEIEEIFEDVPSSSLNKSFLEGTGTNILDILSTVGVTKSKGDARRSVEEGGIYLNNQRVIDARQQITLSDSIGGNFLILRKGRKNFTLVKIT